MKRSFQVGITGGIGAGKSLASTIFSKLGVPVYNSDHNAKRLMTTDAVLIAQIKKLLGSESYLSDNTLNRKFISQLTFNSPAKINALNALVHPRVGEDYKNWIKENARFPYTLKETALLFETGSYKELDAVIVVAAPESLRIQRVLHRDPQRSEQDVKDIMKNQMAEAEKIQRADFVIKNDESELLIPQILKIDQTLRKKYFDQQ